MKLITMTMLKKSMVVNELTDIVTDSLWICYFCTFCRFCWLY